MVATRSAKLVEEKALKEEEEEDVYSSYHGGEEEDHPGDAASFGAEEPEPASASASASGATGKGKGKGTPDDEALSTILLSMKSNNSPTPGTENTTTTSATATATAETREISPSATTETPAVAEVVPPAPAPAQTPAHTLPLPLPPPPQPMELGTAEPRTGPDGEILDETEYNRQMTIEYLRQYFHLPLGEVAQLWGISKPAFKKLCRQHGIKRWPSRQVSSIINSITSLQTFCQENELPDKILKEYETRLVVLHSNLEKILQAPNTLLEDLKHEEPKREVSARTSIPYQSPDYDYGTLIPADGDSTLDLNTARTPESEASRKRKRSSGASTQRVYVHSPLDPHTGWIAECHRCGKIGKFRNVFEGRPFQHSTGDGKYCGYFRVNPRKIGTVLPEATTLPLQIEELHPTSIAAIAAPTQPFQHPNQQL